MGRMKRLPSATRDEVALCNRLIPPNAGVHVGAGVHVVIPEDWQARIARGEHNQATELLTDQVLGSRHIRSTSQ